MLARRRPQPEQPLLHLFELARIERHFAPDRLKRLAGGIERHQGLIHGFRHGRKQGRLGVRFPRQPPQQHGERRPRGIGAVENFIGVVDFPRRLFEPHEPLPALGQLLFLPRLGFERGKLLNDVPRVVFLTGRLFHARPLHIHCLLGRRQLRISVRNGIQLALISPETVEQQPMRRRVDQGSIIMLAMDFHQQRADRFQQPRRNRLIVDESPRAPIGVLHAAQDDFGIVGNLVFAQQHPGRMVFGQRQHRHHLPAVRALAHQRRVAASTQRQGQRVEQDRFARAGFAGQHGQPRLEGEVQLIDQNDVADRQRV